ncbi:MAG: hypothetical protein M0R77_00365 [Gammaproteobacteria bacterium]|nr:hypothetical protein [Acholeplasmataceae bacterium]MCK9529007.1 hypothetical protein [Gammaproteobacteria bacterium]
MRRGTQFIQAVKKVASDESIDKIIILHSNCLDISYIETTTHKEGQVTIEKQWFSKGYICNPKIRFKKEEKEEMVKQLLEKSYTQTQISKLLDLPQSTISVLKKKFGLIKGN